MDEDKLCGDMINLYREQRHDFLNHFQVVLGYLQLKKADRAITYIKQVNQEMQELSSVTKLENPCLVMVLLLAFQKSKNMGIDLFFQIEGSFYSYQNYDKGFTDQMVNIIDCVLLCLSAEGKEEQWMKITLKENDHNTCIITCSSFIIYEELIKQLHNQFKGSTKIWDLQVDKLEEHIRIIFRAKV